MPFSYMDHTGDVGVEIEADSLEDLLVDASKAFADILTDPSLIEARETVKLSVQALDPTELLLHWLEELLYLFDTRGLLATPKKLTISTNRDGTLRLDAEIVGEEIDPSRHPVRVQIKAVTYHCLEVRQQGDRWLGRVIFDI
jgi:SHS2 domain-containing protein